MIEVKNLWFSYDKVEVLRGVNFKAMKGEVTVLMSKNGAGKTTLLMHLNGLLRPKRGEIWVDGNRVSYDRKSLIELRKKVVYVFQNPDDQIIAPTVSQDVAFGPANLGLRNLKNIVSEALKVVGLEGYEKRLCSTLSGGEKKKLAIASAIAMNPEYVIMDEPTSGVDMPGFKAIVEIVERLRQNKGLIVSTHDIDFAKAIGDKFVFMDAGRVVYESDEIDFSLARELGIRTFYSGKLIVVPHNAVIPDVSADFVAAMGYKAKERAAKDGINVDITSAVLERSILRAIEGHTVLLLCSTEMLNVVRREVAKFPVYFEILDEDGRTKGGTKVVKNLNSSFG
jgi:cobalt/nickel transport system ATP-binding protein